MNWLIQFTNPIDSVLKFGTFPHRKLLYDARGLEVYSCMEKLFLSILELKVVIMNYIVCHYKGKN